MCGLLCVPFIRRPLHFPKNPYFLPVPFPNDSYSKLSRGATFTVCTQKFTFLWLTKSSASVETSYHFPCAFLCLSSGDLFTFSIRVIHFIPIFVFYFVHIHALYNNIFNSPIISFHSPDTALVLTTDNSLSTCYLRNRSSTCNCLLDYK